MVVFFFVTLFNSSVHLASPTKSALVFVGVCHAASNSLVFDLVRPYSTFLAVGTFFDFLQCIRLYSTHST